MGVHKLKNDLKSDKQFLQKLKESNIDESDIILSCPLDLSPDGTYIRGYLFVTSSQTGTVTSVLPPSYINCFKGIDTKDMETPDVSDMEIKLYDSITWLNWFFN